MKMMKITLLPPAKSVRIAPPPDLGQLSERNVLRFQQNPYRWAHTEGLSLSLDWRNHRLFKHSPVSEIMSLSETSVLRWVHYSGWEKHQLVPKCLTNITYCSCHQSLFVILQRSQTAATIPVHLLAVRQRSHNKTPHNPTCFSSRLQL